MSKWDWGGAGTNQVVTITPEAVAAHQEKPAAKASRSKTSPLIRILPLVSLVLSAAVIVLLVYFFKHSPSGISGQQIMNRFANIATSAAILAGLGVLFGTGVFFLAKKNNENLQVSARVLSVISIVLAAGVFGTAVFCWSRTERATLLSAPASDNELLQRLTKATVVIQAHDPTVNRYRSAKREGVIVGADAGRTWILTVPFLDGNGNAIQPPDLWVDLSDGRTVAGRFVWAQTGPLPLAIIEVKADKTPGQIQFHPNAEAFIPGQRRLVRLHPHIETEGVSGNPPEVYRLFLTVRSLQQRGEEIFFVDRHRLEISLPRAYPRDAPICRMLTPVFHPNIAPHAVCITDNWSAAESLSSVIMRVCEMLAFQSYNIKSPLNGEAAQWTAQHLKELPTDKREFFLDLDQTLEPAAAREAVCSN
jgi:hypothetical protein